MEPGHSEKLAFPTAARNRRFLAWIAAPVAVIGAVFGWAEWSAGVRLRAAEEVIKEVERFQSENHRRPVLAELGEGSSECPHGIWRRQTCLFYRTVGSGYVIGYSLGFDEDDYYDSRSRSWYFGALAPEEAK